MTCEEALDRAAARSGEVPPPGLLAHLKACASCRDQARTFEGVDDLVAAVLDVPLPPLTLPAPRRRMAWSAAAAVLLLAGGWLLNPEGPGRAAPATRSRQASFPGLLETATGTRVHVDRISGAWRLRLGEGACWVEARERVQLEERVRISAGSRLEIRRGPPASRATWGLLRESRAADGGELILSVFEGEVQVEGFRIPSGIRVSLSPGQAPAQSPLTEADRIRVEGWRAERITTSVLRRWGPAELAALASLRVEEGAVALRATPTEIRLLAFPVEEPDSLFWAEIRVPEGHVVLRHPHGEVLLGDLPAWRDGRWHVLTARSGSSGMEVFLDGRSLIRGPSRASGGGWALGVRGGELRVRAAGT